MQREIQSQLQDKGIGTKAQKALKLQHEQCKLERKTKSREQKEAEKERQFAIRQEKKKTKHRGRYHEDRMDFMPLLRQQNAIENPR